MKGKVKRIVRDKGFGFIITDDGEYFFHRTALTNVKFEELKEGDDVEFDVEESTKGPRATNVSM